MGITVTSTVYINQTAIKKLNEAARQALGKTGAAVLKQIKNTQVMPFDTGTLQNDSTYVDGSQLNQGVVSIVSATPYARRLYFHPEYEFQHTYNANAGARWFYPWSTGARRDFIPKAFARFYKEAIQK